MEEKKEIQSGNPSGSSKGHIFKPCDHHPFAQRVHHRLRDNPSGLPKPDISNRIVMTPEHAKRLLNALMDNVTKYESQFGLINLGGGQAQQGGTFNLGDLPQFGPNGAKS